jgi:hypothetical protein
MLSPPSLHPQLSQLLNSSEEVPVETINGKPESNPYLSTVVLPSLGKFPVCACGPVTTSDSSAAPSSLPQSQGVPAPTVSGEHSTPPSSSSIFWSPFLPSLCHWSPKCLPLSLRCPTLSSSTASESLLPSPGYKHLPWSSSIASYKILWAP